MGASLGAVLLGQQYFPHQAISRDMHSSRIIDSVVGEVSLSLAIKLVGSFWTETFWGCLMRWADSLERG